MSVQATAKTGIGSLPRTGLCQRPKCGQVAPKGRVYCSRPCHAADFSRRSTGIRKQPWKPVKRNCAGCGVEIRRTWPSELPRTCSKVCEGRWKREQLAEGRLRNLVAKGIKAMDPIEAYTWGYKNGYQRRVMRDRAEARRATPVGPREAR